MSQSYPLVNDSLTTTNQYAIIPLDTKCAVHNASIQITPTNTSGSLSYKIERTVYPVQKCVYPTFNTSESVLNSQASWDLWVGPTGGNASVLYNNTVAAKGIKITLLAAGAGDSLKFAFIQQGVL